MRWEHIVAELGEATGLEGLAPDAHGSCSLLFDGEHELTLVRDATESAVFIYGRVAESVAVRGEEAWHALLAASCLGAETGGAAFALYGKSLILWKRHDAFEDCPALEKALNSFLAQIILWKERLAVSSPYVEGAKPRPASEADMLRI